MKPSARGVALKVLLNVLQQQQPLSSCLDAPLATLTDPRERALAQALVYGVLRWLPRLQGMLAQLLTKPLKAKDGDIEAVLLLGLYQLLYSRVPAHAALAETVNLTRQLKKNWASGLVNGVLRNVQRQQATLLTQADSNAAEPSVRSAHPAWLCEQLQHDWGAEWEAIAHANNQHPPLTLRVNASKMTRSQYLTYLQQADINATPTPYSAVGITLDSACDVTQLPGYEQGWFAVQDEAAQLAATFLPVPDGVRVLDACAAPGGKTAHLLETYPNSQVFALDNHPARLAKVDENLQRLGLHATTCCADAADLNAWWDGQTFARILLDAPCSASGVIRRHPDIKYLRHATDVVKLQQQQALLLTQLWQTLQPGGLLLYATCSLFQTENEAQIAAFLPQHTDAQVIALDTMWGRELRYGRQGLPHTDKTDGFYYACLQKMA